MCINHSNLRAEGQCLMCGKTFCDDCLQETDGLVFCKEHFSYFVSSHWLVAKKVVSTSETPEAALDLYHKQEKWWGELGIPCFIKVDYALSKISDVIESHVSLMVDSNYQSQIPV